VRLTTPFHTFPVSDLALRVDDQGIRLAPVRVRIAPRVEIVAEGAVHGLTYGSIEPADVAVVSHRPSARRESQRSARAAGELAVPPRYEIALSAKSVSLDDLLRAARAEGMSSAPGVEAQGPVTAELRLDGAAWPFARPVLSGDADLRDVRLIVPGLAQPIHLARARAEVAGSHVSIGPLEARIGNVVFSGRLQHEGARARPWNFDLRTPKLSWDEGALWFEAVSQPPQFQVLEYIPGLRSLAARRSAGGSLFGALNAEGRFAADTLSYRALALSQLSARVEISGRVIRASNVTFKAAGGEGQGGVRVDLTSAPARITGTAAISGANLETWSAHLPPQLRKARGRASASVRFQTRGLSRQEIGEYFEGKAIAQLKEVSFGGFDPCAATARAAGWGTLAPGHGDADVRSVTASIDIAHRRVNVMGLTLPLSGAQFIVAGTFGFDGAADFQVRADLSHLNRRWNDEVDPELGGRVAVLRVTGPLQEPAVEVSAAPVRAQK